MSVDEQVVEDLFAALDLLRKHECITNAPSNVVAEKIRKLDNEVQLRRREAMRGRPHPGITESELIRR